MNTDTRSSPPAVGLLSLLLIAANVGVYVLQGLLQGLPWIDRPVDAQLAWGGNLALLSLTGDRWRLVASMFLHGGLVHLLMNMYMLFLIGPAAERQFGRLGMLMLYLGGGALGSCASAWWTGSHLMGQLQGLGGAGRWMIVSVGASGALMALCGGLLGAVALGGLLGHHSPLGEGFGKSLAQVVLINVVAGAVISGVDQAAHIGGLLGGLLMGALMSLGGPRPGGLALLWRGLAPVLVGLAGVGFVTSGMDWGLLRELRQQQQDDQRERQPPEGESSVQAGRPDWA